MKQYDRKKNYYKDYTITTLFYFIFCELPESIFGHPGTPLERIPAVDSSDAIWDC